MRRIVVLDATIAWILFTSSSAQAVPFYCGTVCKLKDPTALTWRDVAGAHKSRSGSYGTWRPAGYGDVNKRSKQEDEFDRQYADRRSRENKEEEPEGSLAREIRCKVWHMEYIIRHGTHTPRPLKPFRGCEKWSRDHYYWKRRNGI